jgi:hypothetical protein
MPYWNRPRELARSIAAYGKVYPDLDLEFSVADDGSAFPPEKVANMKIAPLPKKWWALNPCVPINVAIRAASHDVIVLTNPEVEHRERVLDKMLSTLVSENDYVMTGCHDDQIGRIAGPGTPRAPIGGRLPIPPGTELHFCVMFHRALFERAGGFDEAFRRGHACDDNDWLWKLYTLGDVNFKYVDGVVWHYRTPKRVVPRALHSNMDLLAKKWGHLEEYRCAS